MCVRREGGSGQGLSWLQARVGSWDWAGMWLQPGPGAASIQSFRPKSANLSVPSYLTVGLPHLLYDSPALPCQPRLCLPNVPDLQASLCGWAGSG